MSALPPHFMEGLPPASPSPSSVLHSPGYPTPAYQTHFCFPFPWECARKCHPLSPKQIPTQFYCIWGLSHPSLSDKPARVGFCAGEKVSVEAVTLLGAPAGSAPAARSHQDSWWSRAGLQTTQPRDTFWLSFLLDCQLKR